jgi:ABC-type maltose transport system permease subunit
MCFYRFFLNTLLYAAVTIVGVCISSSLVAYGFARVRWPGLAALVVTLTALGYVLLLVARSPWPSAAALWSLCVRLAVRNLLVTGPLFLIEIVGATLLALADPALVLIGLPIALVYVMRATAQYGFHRADKR